MAGIVMAVSRSATHTLIKSNHPSIRLLTGLGIEGDAHLHLGEGAVLEVTGLRNVR